MIYNSCFDIIGPIMVGPSSSHTAGVVSIGKFVYEFLRGEPDAAVIDFYDSFSETYRGHGTDKAVVGGLLGMDTDNMRIRKALEIAQEQKVEIVIHCNDHCPYYDHPNTVLIRAHREGISVTIGGVSLGGGISKIFQINGYSLDIPLNSPYNVDLIRENISQEPRYVATVGGEKYGF